MATEREIVGAVGAGRMGRGIAVACALAGYPVHLIDVKPRSADAFTSLAADATREILETLAFFVDTGLLNADQIGAVHALVTLVDQASAGLSLTQCDIVFEAVPETLEAKRDAFAVIGSHCRPTAPVASTTSTIGVEDLAKLIAGPERFLNAHWLNPGFLMPLVELSPSAATAPETTAAMKAWLKGIGKVPVVCRASPGYIVPRIQALACAEACRLVEEGVASAEDVDLAISVGFGLRFATLGMLEFVDWGGGDILYYALSYLSENIDKDRFATPKIVADYMKQGRRGLRDGVGFHDFTGRDIEAYRKAKLGDFVTLLKQRGLMPKYQPS
jgi:3-hydroxybutyryl-CoA dehydrogenase